VTIQVREIPEAALLMQNSSTWDWSREQNPAVISLNTDGIVALTILFVVGIFAILYCKRQRLSCRCCCRQVGQAALMTPL
jgi:Gpi18-like mannosyltransferase